jgi:hypothetical protein
MPEMLDHAPKYQCPECRRGVLNRRVSHCLYCGAQLPASVLASPADVAVADANLEHERKTYALSAPGPARDPASDLVEAVEAGFGIIDLLR